MSEDAVPYGQQETREVRVSSKGKGRMVTIACGGNEEARAVAEGLRTPKVVDALAHLGRARMTPPELRRMAELLAGTDEP